MHVIVIGAGVIGVCSAWYLREAGFEVTVVERARRAGAGIQLRQRRRDRARLRHPLGRARHAGQGAAQPLASTSPVLFRPSADPAMWRWIARWLGECTLERYRVSKLRMQRLAFYSRECLHTLRNQLEIDYEQSQGYLQLFRTERDRSLAEPALALLREHKVPHRLVDAAGCRGIEPGLATDTPLAGGLHLPEDESGNCPMFVRRLRVLAEAAGVHFVMDSHARALRPLPGGKLALDLRAGAARATRETLTADRVLVSAGVASAALLRPLGLRIPLYPVKGYSATVQVSDELQAPLAALMDESYKVAITRMGNRVRIAGTAELGSRKLDLRLAAINTLLKVARDWFPVAGHYDNATLWAGARPMLPDGPPLIGATAVPGLFLNLGHGSTGWAMACGSGRIAADLIAGNRPGIDLDGLTPARYGLGPR
ncbi:D-amino acid dehydrogenase [Cupriavidus basilensis]